MSLAKKREDLHQKTFLMMFRILLFFAIPAIAAFFAGRYIDITYDMRPYGSLMALGIAFILSWTLIIRMYLGVNNEYKELERLEAIEDVKEEKK